MWSKKRSAASNCREGWWFLQRGGHNHVRQGDGGLCGLANGLIFTLVASLNWLKGDSQQWMVKGIWANIRGWLEGFLDELEKIIYRWSLSWRVDEDFNEVHFIEEKNREIRTRKRDLFNEFTNWNELLIFQPQESDYMVKLSGWSNIEQAGLFIVIGGLGGCNLTYGGRFNAKTRVKPYSYHIRGGGEGGGTQIKHRTFSSIPCGWCILGDVGQPSASCCPVGNGPTNTNTSVCQAHTVN